MKKLSLLFVVLLLGIQIYAQRDQSYLKTSIAMNFMWSQSDDPNFKLMGISKNNRLPSVRFSTRPIVYNTSDFQIFMRTGFGLNYRGFGYEYNSDTSYYMKIAGPNIIIGAGIEYLGLGRYGYEHPISFSVSYISMLPFIQTNYLNQERVNVEFGSDYESGFMHGVNFRLDYRINSGDPGVIIFTALDYFPKKLEYFAFDSMYSSYTFSIGISLATRNGLFEPWSF